MRKDKKLISLRREKNYLDIIDDVTNNYVRLIPDKVDLNMGVEFYKTKSVIENGQFLLEVKDDYLEIINGKSNYSIRLIVEGPGRSVTVKFCKPGKRGGFSTVYISQKNAKIKEK